MLTIACLFTVPSVLATGIDVTQANQVFAGLGR
jgi:hypothetical protein